jgi:hypothetical protein
MGQNYIKRRSGTAMPICLEDALCLLKQVGNPFEGISGNVGWEF